MVSRCFYVLLTTSSFLTLPLLKKWKLHSSSCIGPKLLNHLDSFSSLTSHPIYLLFSPSGKYFPHLTVYCLTFRYFAQMSFLSFETYPNYLILNCTFPAIFVPQFLLYLPLQHLTHHMIYIYHSFVYYTFSTTNMHTL